MSLRIPFAMSAEQATSASTSEDAQTSGPPPGPPYPPQHQSLGQVPSVMPDVPISAVFLLLFIIGAAAHMTVLQVNQHKKHKKFVLNGAVFGFCFTRICATSLRIAWAVHPRNVQVGMAAMIFVYAGIPILFICNLFFAQRIVRAQHPQFGWIKPCSTWIPVLLVIIVGTIFALISAVIVMFYTYKPSSQRAARDIQAYGSVFFTLIAFLPIPIVGISTLARLLPSVRNTKTTDKFGAGRLCTKIAISLFSSALLTLGAAYRADTTLDPLTPRNAPQPWYFSKACFYIFNFTLEIIIVYLWWFTRIDQRFYIPDGAHGPGSYAGGFVFAGEEGHEKHPAAVTHHHSSSRNLLAGNRASGTSFAPTTSRRTSFSSKRHRSMECMSWGGISRDRISIAYGEDGVAVPHRLFDDEGGDLGETERLGAEDVGIEGVEKEMGWDPKTGKWALRPISIVEKARVSGPRYDAVSQEEEEGRG